MEYQLDIRETRQMIEEIETADLMRLSTQLESIVEKALEKGSSEGGSLLAEMVYNLFQSATFKKNENARLLLRYIQNNLGRLTVSQNVSIGVMMHSFSLRWFRLISKLEEIIIDYEKRLFPEKKVSNPPLLHDKYATKLYELLPCLEDPIEAISSNKELIAQVKQLLSGQKPGNDFQKLFIKLQKKALFEEDQEAKIWLIDLQSHLPTLIDSKGSLFSPFFFDFAMSWFKHNVTLRKKVKDLMQDYELQWGQRTKGRQRPKAFTKTTSFAEIVNKRKQVQSNSN